MGSATQLIGLAAGFLVPAFRDNRVRSMHDFGRLLNALRAILYLTCNSAAAALPDNCISRIAMLQSLSTKADLDRA